MNYKEKKIAILGLARSGMAVAKLLISKGAEVYISDAADNEILRKRAGEFRKLGAIVELGGHSDCRLNDVDEVVLSPGVPTDIPILLWFKSNRPELPIVSEIEIGYRFAKGKIIGITGSNGKSTCVTMLGGLFRAAGYESHVAGNIGNPLCDVVGSAGKNSIICVELSSFQLESIEKFRPYVSCLLNLSPDHLDRHYVIESYYNAKTRIFSNQTDGDYAVLFAGDEKISAIGRGISAKTLFFDNAYLDSAGSYADNGTIYIRKPDGAVVPVLRTSELSVPGPHNIANACAALACTIPFDIPPGPLADALRKFSGLPHRLQFVGEINGVRFINDSKATNADSLECALKSFDSDVVLIVGGYDKGADFTPLRELVARRAKCVVLMGATADKIAVDWKEAAPMEKAENLEEAVAIAKRAAGEKGTVLLAPGCASYDMFENFEDRGNQFAEIVQKLTKRENVIAH